MDWYEDFQLFLARNPSTHSYLEKLHKETGIGGAFHPSPPDYILSVGTCSSSMALIGCNLAKPALLILLLPGSFESENAARANRSKQ